MSRGKRVKKCRADRSYIDDEKGLSYPCGGGRGGVGVDLDDGGGVRGSKREDNTTGLCGRS